MTRPASSWASTFHTGQVLDIEEITEDAELAFGDTHSLTATLVAANGWTVSA
ncbi:hypothetical protein [Streptomyces sp. NPDC013457]|uniref:hypothetical protein n=1 Tax=Streptomyces sp. NPDC013457 TaxID=3364866 RepID=UPI0036F849B5